jgi:uncharacterized cupredoxin-like copper-binding protein
MNYRLPFVMILAVALLTLMGCTASAASNTTSGNSSEQPAVSSPAATTSATRSQARVVHVTISNNGIAADHSTFYAGTLYHFVVTNTSQVAYQFVMGQGGYGHMMGQGRWNYNHMPTGWQHYMTPYWSYQIAPGATATFDYTFPASEVSPYFGFGCYQQGGQGGMWYPSTVQPQS